ncbi:MAG: iron ABC transporter substrate-binding protein [Eggerthellaceae bacterium]
MLGRTVEVPTQVDSVIGIGSSSLRFITYLESIDKVVGVEQSELEDNVACPYRHVYHDELSQLPVIGDGGSKGVTPNEEAIMQVNPQVIIANIDKDAADSLQERTGIPVVCITVGNLIFDQDFYDSLKLVGQVLGKEDRAAQVIDYMNETEQDLKSRTADIEQADTATAYAAGISYRGGHGFAGTEAQFAPFDSVKVTNIVDSQGISGAFDIDLEAVSTAQPDFIFVESNNLSLVKEDYQANPEYFQSLDAVKNNQVYTLISYRFYSTNAELALANCYQVGAVAYPDRFADVDPIEKLDEITEFFLGQPLSSDLAETGCEFKQIDLSEL